MITENIRENADSDDTPNRKYDKIRSWTPTYDAKKEKSNFARFVSSCEFSHKKHQDSEAGAPGKPSIFSSKDKRQGKPPLKSVDDLSNKQPSSSSVNSNSKKLELEISRDHTEKLHHSLAKDINLDADTHKNKNRRRNPTDRK